MVDSDGQNIAYIRCVQMFFLYGATNPAVGGGACTGRRRGVIAHLDAAVDTGNAKREFVPTGT